MAKRTPNLGPKYIYVLLDAGRHPRYVGQTNNLKKRLRYHWNGRERLTGQPLLREWLLSLDAPPGIMALQQVPVDQAYAAERYWISLLSQVPGVDLVNSAHNGYAPSDEWRAAISAKMKGCPQDPEHLRKFLEAGNAAKVGRVVSPETRRKISEAQRGRKFTEEHKAKLRAGQARHKAQKAAEATG